MKKIVCLITCVVFIFSSLLVKAEDLASEIELETHGFIRVDYGSGDRYPKDDGEDLLGVSKSALVTKAKYENITGVFVIGAELLTGNTQNQSNNGGVGIKDAFIVIDKLAGGNLSLSVGAQPLLFGLKPNGYPADRSIQGSIEYGATGALAVSQQAGPSVIADLKVGDTGKIHFVLFDSNTAYTDSSSANSGSTLTDNFILQYSMTDAFVEGLYLNVGLESLTNSFDDRSSIATLGAGYKFDQFDVSLEAFRLDKEAALTVDDETYLVAEFSYTTENGTLLYLDYSKADQLKSDAIRLGASIPYNKLLSFMVEYSSDSVTNGEDSSSIDFRAAISF